MRKILCASLTAACFVTVWAFQRPPIRVEVQAVNVLITVVDENGRYVTDLDRDRFQVFEEGKPQKITNFTRETNLPLRIALLIDTSASIRTHLDFEKESAIRFLHTVMKPRDQALLVEFDRGVTLLQDFTNRPSKIAQKIRSLRAGGGTALLDALYLVADQKMAGLGGRKTAVVVSDGMDLDSRHNEEDSVQTVLRAGLSVYSIGTNRMAADSQNKGKKLLERLSEETGGRVFFPYSSDQLEAAFEQIDRELRSQYSLTYIPTNKKRDGKFRKIKVKLADGKSYKLHYRTGYYAPEPRKAGH